MSNAKRLRDEADGGEADLKVLYAKGLCSVCAGLWSLTRGAFFGIQ